MVVGGGGSVEERRTLTCGDSRAVRLGAVAALRNRRLRAPILVDEQGAGKVAHAAAGTQTNWLVFFGCLFFPFKLSEFEVMCVKLHR